MSVAAIVQRRRQNLLATFVRSTPPLVEVEDAQGLGRLLMLDEFHEGAATGALGRRGLGNVVMVAAAPGQCDAVGSRQLRRLPQRLCGFPAGELPDQHLGL